jgi:hypothetical protein
LPFTAAAEALSAARRVMKTDDKKREKRGGVGWGTFIVKKTDRFFAAISPV